MTKHRKSHSQKHGPRAGSSRTTPGSKAGRKMDSFSRVSTQNQKSKPKPQRRKGRVQKNQQPIVPFLPSDRILLVGEGDFSFSLSLAANHGCKRILATCYDSEDILYQKYPQAKQHINQLCGQLQSTASARGLKRKRDGTPGFENRSKSDDEPTKSIDASESTDRTSPKVLFSIDARKLGLTGGGGGGKVIRKGFSRLSRKKSRQYRFPKSGASEGCEVLDDESGPWDIICFNFPHVGGLSTDVNRQVRANQELLVSFFKACVPLLSAPPLEGDGFLSEDEDEDDDEEEGLSGASYNGERPLKSSKMRTEPGQVIVTLFEGEPYTLWNIRDLARHAGLRVVTSFKFPWVSYPGYSHARTLGEIEGRDGGRGGWRGEKREARSYVFERKEFEGRISPAGKRKRKDDSDDSDDG
ncbi:adenosylmethionine-dependent methyltransferase [Emydomyces testavorans]|uniref:Adenosylmethionine-dependent methyltransferase n=1 Tax=Emydomyces testavorans TaxID=2070801 RepID=A0AAF0IGY0_9EURO|nr:adenosylmethionine-dependent methyltransferase [Emydomyces testavorans]